MALYVIFDRGAGYYQWGGEFEDDMAALADFDAKVGIDPHGEGLEALRKQYDIRKVTPDQFAAVEAWQAAGAKAAEFPLDKLIMPL